MDILVLFIQQSLALVLFDLLDPGISFLCHVYVHILPYDVHVPDPF